MATATVCCAVNWLKIDKKMCPVQAHITGAAMVTSLGVGVEENFNAIAEGRTGIRKTAPGRASRNEMMVGLIPEDVYEALYAEHDPQKSLTRTELLIMTCVSELMRQDPGIADEIKAGEVSVVIASAKGNISLLENSCNDGDGVHSVKDDSDVLFGSMVRLMSSRFGFPEKKVRIISNACISGVSALVIGWRHILESTGGKVIVVGVDTQNRFITSGFASFKSLSGELCTPYDKRRCGLNLGEACGAVILSAWAPLPYSADQVSSNSADPVFRNGSVAICGGAISDDANHISGPSRTGDGLYFAMRNAMNEAGIEPASVSCLQMHGTATAYNDDMESKAANLAGLQDVPVQSLKPYFGHTMGASGVIETIIAAEELRRGIFVGTKGFEEPGTTMPLNVSAANIELPAGDAGPTSDKVKYCVKTASGFGGTNAALVLAYPCPGLASNILTPESPGVCTEKSVLIENGRLLVGDSRDWRGGNPYRGKLRTECLTECPAGYREVFTGTETDFSLFIRELYKFSGESNMKFYKMDDLCRLGYMAAHYLLEGVVFGEEECGIVLSGKYGCLDTDMKHQHIIDTEGDDAASPAVFVYTLPNVVAGEISIRHHIKGENTWFWSGDRSMADIRHYAESLVSGWGLKYCILGHLDFLNGEYFANFELVGRI